MVQLSHHHESPSHMGHHMIKSRERERGLGHMGSPEVSSGSHDRKKYLGTLQLPFSASGYLHDYSYL